MNPSKENYEVRNPISIATNNGFWDRDPQDRAARMEAACERAGVANFSTSTQKIGLKHMTKTIKAEYIESGTFVAGEEDVYNANVKSGETCYILRKDEYDKLIQSKNNEEAWWTWWKYFGSDWYIQGKYPQHERPPFLQQGNPFFQK